MFKLIKRLKTKYGVFLSILVLFSVVVTLSYSAFIFSTDKYSKKYEGEQLKRQIKNHLYKKGFITSDIDFE